MSAKGAAPSYSAADAALARETSLLLDNGAVSLLATRDTGHSAGPADFRGAFGCVRHGLHGLPGIDEYGSGDGELKLPLQKLTSISNIVPAGVQLELVGLRGASGAGGSTAAGGARRPDGAAQQPLFGRQLHSQRQKQGSQQRGPGRPERPPPAGAGPLAAAAAAAAPTRPSPTKRAASEPAAAPAPAAAAPVAEGAAPAPAPKKMLKFKVKLNGKVVASAGGGPAVQLPSASPPQLAPEADTIVERMCGLGGAVLLSPLPTQWARIVGSPSPCEAAEPARGSTPPSAQRQQEPQQPAGGAVALTRDPGSGHVDVSRDGSPCAAGSPFAALALQAQEQGEREPPAQQCSEQAPAAGLQSVLSPVPSLWGRIVEGAPGAAQEPPAPDAAAQGGAPEPAQPAPRRQPAGEQAEQAQPRQPAAKSGSGGKRSLESAAGEGQAGAAGAAAPAPKRQRSTSAEPGGEEHAAASPPAAAPAAVPAPATRHAQQPRPEPKRAPEPVPASSPNKRRQAPQSPAIPRREASVQPRSSAAPSPAASPAKQQSRQVQPPGAEPAAAADSSPLGLAAAPLRTVVQQAAESGAMPSSSITNLQEEGRRLKRFAERKMAGERHTHVSCTFLLSSGLKFLSAAGIMEAAPHKYSRESTSTMYSQTAAMLESCAHAAARAEGPTLGTQAVALLAERLGAVARLRAAHVLRAELNRDVLAFRNAVETARGETFQRPSPTDSNVSATMALPLEAGSPGGAAAGRKKSPPQPAGVSSPAASGRAAAAGGKRSGSGGSGRAEDAGPQLLGMPRAIVDRELAMASHMQGMMQALSAFSRSSEKLREYMGKAATEGNAHAMRAAAGTLLLSADAGMGRLEPVVNIGREALDAAMQIEA